MSHGITESDGLVLTGKRAWHNLGTVVESAPSPHEALKIAKMDWEVYQTDGLTGYTGNPEQEYIGSKNWVFNYRSDINTVLGCVSSTFVPIQNETLAEFANALSNNDTGVKVESAGSVYEGKRVWFLLRAEAFDVSAGKADSKEDEVIPYILLANGHDGSLAFSARPTSVRVVCNNTLAWALGRGSKNVFNLKHSSNIMDRVDEAKKKLTQYMGRVGEFSDSCEYLREHTMNQAQVQTFFLDMYTKLVAPIPTEPKNIEEQKKRDTAMYGVYEMCQNFDMDTTVAGATAWNAFNSTTRWLQNRGRTGSSDVRAYNKLLGNAADKSREAFRYSLELSEAL